MLRTVGDHARHLGLEVRPDTVDSPDVSLQREVRWVAVRAIDAPLTAADPVQDGELVVLQPVTQAVLDGIGDADVERWVGRLVAGRAVGVVVLAGSQAGSWAEALRVAARRCGLPLLEAPESLSADDVVRQVGASVLWRGAAENRRLADGLVALTHAARLGGSAQVVATLADRVDGWAVVVGSDGRLRLGTGGAHLHREDVVAAASGQRRRVRHPGLIVTPIGVDGPLSSQLVVTARPGQESFVRALAAQAAVLLDLVDRPPASVDATRHARVQAVDVLLLGRDAVVQRVADGWGLGAGDGAVVRLRSRSRSVHLEQVALAWLGELGLPELLAADGAAVTAVLPAEAVGDWTARVERASADEQVPVRCGIGASVAVQRLGVSADQATQALEVAVADGRSVVAYATLPTSRLLLGGPGHTALVSRALDGLDAAGAQTGVLLESLRVFLAEVGSWEAAAAQLGVHRHTLRHRIERVEALTGRDLSRMEDRVELWVALRAKGLLGVTT